MKLKFTRKTWYFFLLAAAAVSMLGGFAVLGGMDFSGLEMIVFCLTGIAVLFLAAQKGSPAREKRNYTGVFVVLMLSKLGASGWAGDICSALVWPAPVSYTHLDVYKRQPIKPPTSGRRRARCRRQFPPTARPGWNWESIRAWTASAPRTACYMPLRGTVLH